MISWLYSSNEQEGIAYCATSSASYFALALSLAAGLSKGTPVGMELRIDR